jgi:hypothetical protein
MPDAIASQHPALCNAVRTQSAVAKKESFFSYPDEAMDHRDRGQRMLECEQIMLKVTDQSRSALRAGPAGSDNGKYGARGVVSRARRRDTAHAGAVGSWGDLTLRVHLRWSTGGAVGRPFLPALS